MKKNILVTAVGGRSVGSGILHALTRSSPEVTNRWNVIAADADKFSWGLYKANQKTLLPFANMPNYIDSVNEVIDRFNIQAIIPGSEIEVKVLTKHASELMVPVIANKAELMPLMMDKFKATKKIKELGLPTIPTYEIEDWQEALSKFDFPVIVKPTTGTGGSRGVSICTTFAELKVIINNLPPQSGYCIQPVIGNDDNEYTVGVLSDKYGNLIDSIVMKRKLIGLSLLDTKSIGSQVFRVSTGYSQGFFIKHKEIQDFCEQFAGFLGSRGPLNIQLRLHRGEIYIFEIHPRFSGTTTMRADVGFNEPDILLRNFLFNDSFGKQNYQYDVAVIRAFEHVVVPIKDML